MPWSVRLSELAFALVGLSTLRQLVRLLNPTTGMTADATTLALRWGAGAAVVVTAILLIFAIELRWRHARAVAVAMLVLQAVIALWQAPPAQRWSQALSLSGAGARGEVLGFGLWIILVVILAAQLTLGPHERQYFAGRRVA